MNRYLAELLGTFALVFAGCGAIIVNDVTGAVTHVSVAITFGLVVMAMIYAFGDVSGAHFNPAVTLAFWLSRRLPGRRIAPYIGAQLLGAFLASGALLLLFGNRAHLGATLPHGGAWRSCLLESILTAILVLVILRVSTGSKETSVMAGIAIGGVVAFEALFAGPISGASMNPARSIAPAILSGNVSTLWLYLVGPLLGAMSACLLAAVFDRDQTTAVGST